MFSKIIFALAMVCVVNASVLTAYDDDPEVEVASNTKRCELQACEKLCRKLKFPGGACVRGRCKCDNFPNEEDEDDFSLSDLESSFSQQDDTDADVPDSQNRCKVKACHWVCRMLNKTSGSCVDGRCKCEGTTLNAEENLTDLEEMVSVIDAMNDLDESVSLDENFLSENFLNAEEEAVDEYSELDKRRVCKLYKCGRTCNRRGYEGATCVKGRCKCYSISKTSLPVSELSEDTTERSCNTQACDILCRRLKFSGGACVNGHCKCNHISGAEDAIDEYSELATRRVCELRECSRTCARRGYETSRCVNGWCRCRNKIKTEDTSPLNDVEREVNEESDDISKTNEEEQTAPDSRACNTVNCNQMCHRLKYTGGWCRLGQCRCY